VATHHAASTARPGRPSWRGKFDAAAAQLRLERGFSTRRPIPAEFSGLQNQNSHMHASATKRGVLSAAYAACRHNSVSLNWRAGPNPADGIVLFDAGRPDEKGKAPSQDPI